MSERYPEKNLQLAATAWLIEHRGFKPVYDDVEATGARFDSCGLIEGRLHLVEYKVEVSSTIVRHAPDRAMSLESKIAGGLRALYGGRSDPLTMAAAEVWSRKQRPVVVVAARGFSVGALKALEEIARERARAWAFDLQAWRWSGDAFQTLLDLEGENLGVPYERLDVPELIGKTKRNPNLTVGELQGQAEEEGVGDLFDAFIRLGTEAGFILVPGRTRLGLALPTRRSRVVAAAYLGPASRPGCLNVSTDPETFAVEPFETFSIAPSAGFLNRNVFVTEAAQIAKLLAGPCA